MEQEEKEQIIPDKPGIKEIDRRFLLIPWAMVASMVGWFFYSVIKANVSLAFDRIYGGIVMFGVLIPAIILSGLVFLTFAAISDTIQKHQKNTGEPKQQSHKIAIGILATLAILLFGFCVIYLIKPEIFISSLRIDYRQSDKQFDYKHNGRFQYYHRTNTNPRYFAPQQ